MQKKMRCLFSQLVSGARLGMLALCAFVATGLGSASAQNITAAPSAEAASSKITLPSLFDRSQLLLLSAPLEYAVAPLGSVKSPNDLADNTSAYRFAVLPQNLALPTAAQNEVWLRFSVAPTAKPETWYFRIPKQTLEKATFYSKLSNDSNLPISGTAVTSADSPWRNASAGLSVPNTQWPVRSRDPLFELFTRTDAPQQYYVKIEHTSPVTESMQLIAAADFADGANRVGTLNGLMIGLFSALFLVSLVSAKLNHDRHFGWFALLVLSVLFTQLTLSGYLGLRVWLGSTYLARVTLWIIPLLSLIALAKYCLSISYAKELSVGIYRVLVAVMVLSALLAITLAYMLPDFPRGLINIYYGAAMLTILGCMAWIAWRSQHWLWMVVASLVPLSLSVMARIAYNFGIVAHVELAQLGGVISACLGLLLIYSCMVMQSRGKLSSSVREEVIETRDVATGLFNERIAMARLPQLILRSKRFERSCGVLLVRWTDFSQSMQASADATMRGKMLAHLGSRLARVARDIDTVARVADDSFVILVEAPVSREMLSEIASKILAGCMRPSQYNPEQRGFDTHIAVWESGKVNANAAQVMEMLKTRINQMREGTQRRVQFIDSPLSTAPGKETVDPQKHAQELVAKINSLEATHGLPTIAMPSHLQNPGVTSVKP
jgi:two-component system, sensor histidine kinase LadS